MTSKKEELKFFVKVENFWKFVSKVTNLPDVPYLHVSKCMLVSPQVARSKHCGPRPTPISKPPLEERSPCSSSLAGRRMLHWPAVKSSPLQSTSPCSGHPATSWECPSAAPRPRLCQVRPQFRLECHTVWWALSWGPKDPPSNASSSKPAPT